MVHTHAPALTAPTGAPGTVPAIPQPTSAYVLVPDALILAFAHDPLAVGVYVAVARLVLAARGAVPLAARDLAAWMGSDRDADRAAMMRRIVKLADAGWLIVTRHTAAKHHLLPTWGRDGSGTPRPWCFDQASLGKPDSRRGRRVPLALLDTYLGRLDPRAGQHPAVISRYLSYPLLDLTDIGVYTIGLRAEVMPTTRLIAHDLWGPHGPRSPAERQILLERAACGELRITLDGREQLVWPSMHGQIALEHAQRHAANPPADASARARGSHAGSADRSVSGSAPGSMRAVDTSGALPHSDAGKCPQSIAAPQIAWESWDSDRTHGSSSGSGGGADTADQQPVFGRARGEAVTCAGVSRLQPHEPLIALAETMHDVRSGTRDAGTHEVHLPPAIPAHRKPAHTTGSTVPRQPETLGSSILDPEREALLRAMGVRAPHQLAEAPVALIQAWQATLQHPGLVARFTSPIGFAVSQLRQGQAPPDTAELARWEALRPHDSSATWRHMEPKEPGPAQNRDEAALEARVRALASPHASLAELCALAALLEAGDPSASAWAGGIP